MAATQKPAPGPPPIPKSAAAPPRAAPPPARPAAPPLPPSNASTADLTKAYARDALAAERPYARFAFANPYNLSLLVGGLAASVLTLNPLLAIVTLGGEGLWMLYAPGSTLLRRGLWNPRLEKRRAQLEAEARAARLMALGEEARGRTETLIVRQSDIRRLAATNPSFTGDLLRTELMKTDRLVEAFIDMALTCERYDQYLQSVDLDALEAERVRWERAIKQGAAQDPQVDIAKKNLAIILRRQDKMKEIARYLSVARGQLDLIDNSFHLLADQIVTMQSPQQLSGQLDELLDGVESIRQTAIDTEQIMNGTDVLA
jgi:hypothetical protein